MYQLDSFRLLPYQFFAKDQNRELFVNNIKSTCISGKWIPSELIMTVRYSKEKSLYIEILWDEIKLDPIQSIKYIVPDYYSKQQR